MFERFDEERVTLGHIQGCLYTQELVLNTARWSWGLMYEYSLQEMAVTDLPPKGMMKLKDWQSVLKTRLQPWFVDSYLHIPFDPGVLGINDNTSAEDKEKIRTNYERRLEKVNQRLATKPFLEYFIGLIRHYLRTQNIEAWELCVISEIDKTTYPWVLDLRWDMQADTFFIKNRETMLLLHLAQNLT